MFFHVLYIFSCFLMLFILKFIFFISIHTHTRARAYSHAYACTHNIHKHTHTYILTHLHTYTHTCTYTHAHTQCIGFDYRKFEHTAIKANTMNTQRSAVMGAKIPKLMDQIEGGSSAVPHGFLIITDKPRF